ncbi:MAG: four helix bundle protein [Candidatus Omnitrophica bacterium]|nr:four helix bundle protein [Candidatus Omnitrophota bacterium]
MKIKSFDEIDAWKEARVLTKTVYGITDTRLFTKDFGLKDQARRAAVSVMANIAEGFASFSNPEFIRFLIIARRSCTELKSHFYVAVDQGYISDTEFTKLIQQSDKVSQLINGFIRYLRSLKRINV